MNEFIVYDSINNLKCNIFLDFMKQYIQDDKGRKI